MAKTIVQHDEDRGIAIMIAENRDGSVYIYGGTCTQCGTEVESLDLDRAITYAHDHIDQHESAL